MNIRSEWSEANSSTTDLFYTVQETIDSVKANFDIRRYYSSEGYSVTIDGIVVQVIVQDHANPINESDVDKKILLPMDTVVHTGSYVVFRNQTWMINSNVNIVDDAYKSCQMQYCNYTLKFQSSSGTILSYPCIDSTNSSIGINESNVITTLNGVHTIKLPFDSNTELLVEGRRLIIDKRTTGIPSVYSISKVNSTEYNYGSKGLLELILTQDKFNKDIDKVDLGICNYFEPVVTPPTPDPTKPTEIVTITSDATNNEVKLGITYTFSATFKNELGADVSGVIPQYSMDNTYSEKVVLVDKGDGTATVTVGDYSDTDLCTKQFSLTCTDTTSNISSSIVLTIMGMF